jgi:hypothetical protein
VPESLWVARLYVSPLVRAKLASKHDLDAEDVLDAILCVEGLSGYWDDDPVRGLRAIVETNIRSLTVIVVLYPVDDPIGDAYALGSAYPRWR